MAYSYIRDKTQHDLKLMIVHVNRHETKILFVPNIQFILDDNAGVNSKLVDCY